MKGTNLPPPYNFRDQNDKSLPLTRNNINLKRCKCNFRNKRDIKSNLKRGLCNFSLFFCYGKKMNVVIGMNQVHDRLTASTKGSLIDVMRNYFPFLSFYYSFSFIMISRRLFSITFVHTSFVPNSTSGKKNLTNFFYTSCLLKLSLLCVKMPLKKLFCS